MRLIKNRRQTPINPHDSINASTQRDPGSNASSRRQPMNQCINADPSCSCVCARQPERLPLQCCPGEPQMHA